MSSEVKKKKIVEASHWNAEQCLTYSICFSVEYAISCVQWPSNELKEWKEGTKYLYVPRSKLLYSNYWEENKCPCYELIALSLISSGENILIIIEGCHKSWNELSMFASFDGNENAIAIAWL